MTLAQVQAAVAVFVTLIALLTGLLTSVSLMLPGTTNRAANTLENSIWKCIGLGLLMLIPMVAGIVLIRVPNPVVKLGGVLILLALSGLAVTGGAGLAHQMGKRVGELSGARTSFGSLVRGCLCFALGALFPFVGWYLIAPIALLSCMGAGVLAIRPAAGVQAPPVTAGQGAF